MTKANIAQNTQNAFPYIPANKRSLSHRTLVHGVGINDAPYMVTHTHPGQPMQMCPYHQTWMSMLARVHCPKYHARQPTYIGCSVDPSWLYFMTFREWMETQQWEDMHLDKDILVPGNKHYGPEFCVFVTPKVNTLLNDRAACRGQWPVGVCFGKGRGKFQAYCNNGERKENLGRYDTPQQASAARNKRKAEVITETALDQQDERVRAALLLRAENLLNDSLEVAI